MIKNKSHIKFIIANWQFKKLILSKINGDINGKTN